MAKPHRNSHWKVTNLRGTSGRRCKCSSWMDHWFNYTGRERDICAIVPCGNPAQVGAHVLIDDWRTDFSWWIVPMCHTHNRDRENKKYEMYVDLRTDLVSANPSKSCRRGDWRWKIK